jgi:dihydrofolate reductase
MSDRQPSGAPPEIALVVALADNGVIGRGGELPWHLPDDLKHFRAVTWGKPLLMGRRTYESIGRALPGRRNLVLTSRAAAAPAGVEYVRDLRSALECTAGAAELCVIGGARLYALALPQARRLYLTRVHAQVEGDVRFPTLDFSAWREVARREQRADERHAYAMSFLQLERAAPQRA